jgi:SAM-dependent methyltransferase
MPPGHPEPPQDQPAPTAAEFDAAYSAAPASPGLRKVWQLAVPELPPEIEPFSFVSLDLLGHVADAMNLVPGQTLVDVGCGRGGPGLWLARTTNVSLVGVDFSPVAVEQATQRAALFGLAGRARFVIGDLTRTGLPGNIADAAVSVDAFHFAADPNVVATDARQLLCPGTRLVLTNWQPNHPATVACRPGPASTGRRSCTPQASRTSTWPNALWTRVYQVALDLGDPGDDTALADLQDEARHRLPLVGLSAASSSPRPPLLSPAAGRSPAAAPVGTWKQNVTTGELPATAGVRCASLVRSWGEPGEFGRRRAPSGTRIPNEERARSWPPRLTRSC